MSKRLPPTVQQLQKAIALAQRRGMTRYAIAKSAGMKQAQLSRIADGENVPRLDTAERIAKAIGASLILSYET
jgi:transcriptional regulator with XRE-family HTH domain